MSFETLTNMAKQFLLIALICVTGTLIDLLVHSATDSFRVRPDYFSVNILLAPIWAFLVYRIFKIYFRKPQTLAVLVSFNVAFLLQTKHFFDGFGTFYLMLFMVIHFIMYLIPALYFFKKHHKIFELESGRIENIQPAASKNEL